MADCRGTSADCEERESCCTLAGEERCLFLLERCPGAAAASGAAAGAAVELRFMAGMLGDGA